MAKKIITPEEYKAKIEQKKARRKRFLDAFLKTLALCLAIALVYSATTIAHTRIQTVKPGVVVNTDNGGVKDGFEDPDNSTNSGSTDTGANSGSTDTGANTGNNNSGDANTGANNNSNSNANADEKKNFDLFVNSFKGVKTNAKSATLDKKSAFNYNNHIKANAIIETVAAPLLSSLLKEEVVGETYTGADIAAQFPPSGVTCNLKQDDVKKITCTEEGNYYIVEITVKGSKNPKAGESVGAVASIITEQQISDPIKDIPLINGLKPTCDYHDTTVKAKIEKSTGNMVEYYFHLPMILIMADSSNSYEIGLGFEQWWRIAY